MRALGLLGLLGLSACGEAPMDDWWTVDVGYTEADEPIDTGPLDDQAALHGSLVQIIDGVDVSLRYLWVESGEIRCDVRYTSEKVRSVPCKTCLTALSIVHTGGSIAAGEDCAETGWDSYDNEPLYVGLDAYGSAYQCTEGCTDGSGAWEVAGTSSPNDSGFDFTLDL